MAAAERIFAELDALPPRPQRAGVPAPAAPVRLVGASFTYPGRVAPALADVDLTFAPGERVAVVGPSGAGKTTLARLLLAFERPQHGRLLVGDADLADVDLDLWRRDVAWLPQRPHLPAGTIADAIRLGRAEASDHEVAAAARSAAADGFIRALPDGYATRVGDGGASLSAGQTRRVALARALLRDARMLVLDEPTTNLDPGTGERIAAALARIPRDRTLVLITHDEALAARVADRTVRLDGGRVAAAALAGEPA
jgi:ABC-type multidrug transport system fused ATPase/permease subunit